MPENLHADMPFAGEWTQTRGPHGWRVSGAGDIPTVDPDTGILTITRAPGTPLVLRGPMEEQFGVESLGGLPLEAETDYVAMTMIRASVDSQPTIQFQGSEQGRTSVRRRTISEGSAASPAGQITLLRAEPSYLPGNEVAGTHGGTTLSIPTDPSSSTVEVAPFWASKLEGSPDSMEWPEGEDEDEDEETEPEDELIDSLARRVAAYVGAAGDAETIEISRGQLPVVLEFVRGYTRGRGFTEGEPVTPLAACIVSAGARLVTNPEQVKRFTSADYSEDPALLTGFTLIERRTLNNYRRVWA